MNPEQHNKYLGIAFLTHGAIQLLFMLAMVLFFLFFFSTIPGRPGDPGPPMAFLGFFFGLMFLFQLVFTAPVFVAAYALLKHKSWGRIAGIVGAVLSAMSVPIGTAVCVYALWFLLSDEGKQFYASKATGASPYPLNELHSMPVASEWRQNAKQEEDLKPPQPTDWR